MKRLPVPFLVCITLCNCLAVTDPPEPINCTLEQGFSYAYNLQFEQAQLQFTGWQKEHPEDPLGPVSEAAGLIFSEFDRLGVLESEFFEKDSSFTSHSKLSPDPAVKKRFDDALQRAEGAAQMKLKQDPKNQDALFTLTLANGLRADYSEMIEKKNLDALSYTKQADGWAEKLLAVSPDYYDAYVATGFSKYVIGSLSMPMRWILRLGGYSGDKKGGIHDLELSATKGHYLAPFARLLLAIAYLRQNQRAEARELLVGLQKEFPANPLFPKEIAKIDAQK